MTEPAQYALRMSDEKKVAVVAFVMTILGLTTFTGVLQYRNTQQLIASRAWLTHSQEVLTAAQTSLLRLEQFEEVARLFLATGDQGWQRSYAASSTNYSLSSQQLRELTADNPVQQHHIDELEQTFQQILAALRGSGANASSISAGASLPVDLLSRSKVILGSISLLERTLIARRSAIADQARFHSELTSFIVLGITALLILLLSGFIMRDNWARRRLEAEIVGSNTRLQQTISLLEQRALASALLTDASDELQLSQELTDAHAAVARFACRLLPGTSGALAIINNSRQMAEVVSVWGETRSVKALFSPTACCGLRSGHERWREPGASEIDCAHFEETIPGSYLCLPLVAHGETIGILYIEPSSSAVSERVREVHTTLVELSELCSLAIANLNLREKLRSQSIRDSLTGLFNRQFLEISLDREISRAVRHRSPLTVFMFDVDHFKKFNDAHGHEAGDLVLRELALVVRQSVRAEDIICRYGGEEFVIILPELSSADATTRAEIIRTNVQAMRLGYRGNKLPEITISIGIASFPVDGRRPDELLRIADRFLYDAKHAGRNRTVSGAESVLA